MFLVTVVEKRPSQSSDSNEQCDRPPIHQAAHILNRVTKCYLPKERLNSWWLRYCDHGTGWWSVLREPSVRKAGHS